MNRRIILAVSMLCAAILACQASGSATSNPTVASAPVTASLSTPSEIESATAIAPTATITATFTPSLTSTPTELVLPTDPARSTTAMVRYQIDHAKDPQAVCNDGSTPVFFYRRGYGSGTNRWIIFLQGGAACWDIDTCSARGPGQTSSAPWTQHRPNTSGILSDQPDENPDFHSWNQVYVPYCSSDFWSGMSADNNNPMHFYFRGHAILDAVVDSLSEAGSIGEPGLQQATNILIGGTSAGGIGVRVNLDRLAQHLNWADVRGLADALIFVPTNPDWMLAEQDQIGQEMIDLYQPGLDETCAATNTERPWLCLGYSNDLVDGDISTPIFVRNDLLDPVNMQWQGLIPGNPQDKQYINMAASQYATILNGLPGAFGSASGTHFVAETERFTGDKVDGLSLADVFGNWYFHRDGPSEVVANLAGNR